MDFVKEMKNTLNDEKTLTENGAVAYRTTGRALLDLNFAVGSLRHATEPEIVNLFTKAFFEDKELAIKWLFFARDIREGLGERRLFRICLKSLSGIDEDLVIRLMPYVSEFGRWDDLFSILTEGYSATNRAMYKLLIKQLASDERNARAGKPISLLAKWMPSANASSPKTKALAKKFCKEWGISEREYRMDLSALRRYIDVVERKMCANEWCKIDYSTVPSKANLLYKDAFMLHDADRRRNYLDRVGKGKAKINSSVAFPHEIVHKYMPCWGVEKEDPTLEEMWKALPDLVKGNGDTLVVADGSGSMCREVDTQSSVTALNVADSLAIYFAERSSGIFKDKYITFSERPQLVDLSNCSNLKEKLTVADSHDDVTNTNIEATFDLILQTAINSEATQEDIPKNVLILSDMEFDSAVYVRPDKTLFDNIERKFNAFGYKMPRLVFWNINSSANGIPVKQNKLGVALVSGFSVNVVKMVMSGEFDPYRVLVEQLMSPRYECITMN